MQGRIPKVWPSSFDKELSMDKRNPDAICQNNGRRILRHFRVPTRVGQDLVELWGRSHPWDSSTWATRMPCQPARRGADSRPQGRTAAVWAKLGNDIEAGLYKTLGTQSPPHSVWKVEHGEKVYSQVLGFIEYCSPCWVLDFSKTCYSFLLISPFRKDIFTHPYTWEAHNLFKFTGSQLEGNSPQDECALSLTHLDES